jgi:polyisoprenyl-phosphate glycosyltransferase
MDFSIIIPIYNEEQNIKLLYDRLTAVVKAMQGSYELIFVNDGSRDRSLVLIKNLADTDKAVKFIDLSRNFGHQVAVSAGLAQSSGNAVVIIDADLQDPPELIPEMYERLRSGYEVVYARRKSRKGEGFLKKFTARMFYRILSGLTSISIPLDTGDFRIVDRKVVDVLNSMPEQQKFLRGQISWIGFRQTFVEYNREERHGGKTGYTYRKMIRFAIDGITSFSNFPLKFASIAGFIVSFFSFIMTSYTLYSRLIKEVYVAGWTSLMMAVLFIGGIQLIGIGIIGEYISRMSDNLRNRPLYIINETNITGKSDM